MTYQFAGMDAAMAAAIGSDAELLAELRGAMAQSAAQQADLLARARCDANWLQAAHRLESLAASFGADELLEAARNAIASAPGDPVALRQVQEASAALSAA